MPPVEPDGIGRMAELIARYGLGVVLAIIMVGILIWILKWVMDTSAKREERLAKIIDTSITTLAANLIEVSRSVNTSSDYLRSLEVRVEQRYTQIQDADKFQRQEHMKALELLEEVLSEIGKIGVRVDGCTKRIA